MNDEKNEMLDDALRDALIQKLKSHRLNCSASYGGEVMPMGLVDVLTHPGEQTIQSGIDEIVEIVDACLEVFDTRSDAPRELPGEVRPVLELCRTYIQHCSEPPDHHCGDPDSNCDCLCTGWAADLALIGRINTLLTHLDPQHDKEQGDG